MKGKTFMAWIEPKTDWVDTDFFNFGDYNRIVGNISEIKSLLHDMFPDFGFGVMNYPKDYTSMFYASEMNTIENNLSALNSHSYELNFGNKRSYKINGATPDFAEWNRIENALLTLHEKILAQQEENTSPTFQMMSDTSPNWTSNSTYTIFGKLLDNGNGIGGVKLVEKNQTINVNSDGLFSTTVTLSSGSNKFTLKAWDVDHNPRFYTFTKRYDGTLPVITITSPLNYWSTTSSYTVRGKAVDNESGISSVTVNGTPVTLASDGSFSKAISLTSTSNIFTVTAYNNAGRVVSNSYRVYKDNSSPTLTVVNPASSSSANPTTTVSTSYTVSGTVSDAESGLARVTVNGNLATVNGNNFSYVLTGISGTNVIPVTIVATDNVGHTTTVTRYLRHETQPHSLPVNTTLISGDNGTTTASHTESFLEQGESRQITSNVSWGGYLNVNQLPVGTTQVVVTFIGNRGPGTATYTNLSSNIRLSDSDTKSEWCNETGRWYYVTATAGVRSITAYY